MRPLFRLAPLAFIASACTSPTAPTPDYTPKPATPADTAQKVPVTPVESYAVSATRVASCTVTNWHDPAGVYYSDTTASAFRPLGEHGRWLYLRSQQDTARFVSGLPVKWVSRDSASYVPGKGTGSKVGAVWVVGITEYKGKIYADSVGVQVVADINDCK